MTATCELYLIVEVAPDGSSALSSSIMGVLNAATISSVLFEGVAGAPLDARTIKPFIENVQAKGVAALVSGDAALSRIVKSDGVHLPWSKDIGADYKAAREELGARYILGADAGRSRHDAMELGEAGADYIAFGIPRHVEDRATARERQIDLIKWWSEIFEVPCIAFDVDDAEHAGALARAGADFITLRIAPPMTASDATRLAADFMAAIKQREAVE